MIVRNTLLNDALQPTSGSVTVELVGPGHHADGEAMKRVHVTVGVDGVWTADLPANSTFRVPGTVYRVTQSPQLGSGVTTHTILVRTAAEADAAGIVANVDGSYDLWDLLTDPPGALASSALTAHQGSAGHVPAGANAGDVPTWDTATSRYVAAPPGAASHPGLLAHDDMGLATDADVTNAVAAHNGSGIAHPDIRDAVSNVSSALTTHEGAADPHAGYVLESALTESIQDVVGVMATDSATVNFTYDDVAGTLTAVVQGLTSANVGDFAEAVDDRVSALLVAGANVALTYDDVANTLTVAVTGVALAGHDHDATYVNEADHTKVAHDALGIVPGNGTVADAQVAAGAAIAKSKLAALAIVNADVDAAAAIAESKLNLASDAAAGTASRRTLGTGATQAAAGNHGHSTLTITQQAGAAYTLALADAGGEVETTDAATVTVTVPANATVAFPVGTVVNVRQYGAGQVTIAAAAGVTLRAPNGAKTAKQYSTVSLVKRAVDEWVLSGDAVA